MLDYILTPIHRTITTNTPESVTITNPLISTRNFRPEPLAEPVDVAPAPSAAAAAAVGLPSPADFVVPPTGPAGLTDEGVDEEDEELVGLMRT